jgi:hypothetical protein
VRPRGGFGGYVAKVAGRGNTEDLLDDVGDFPEHWLSGGDLHSALMLALAAEVSFGARGCWPRHLGGINQDLSDERAFVV